MNLFVISYDLIAGKDYQRIINKLTAMGAKRLLLSMWVLRGYYTASDLRDTLKGHIDSDDRLVVVQVADWATSNALVNMNNV